MIKSSTRLHHEQIPLAHNKSEFRPLADCAVIGSLPAWPTRVHRVRGLRGDARLVRGPQENRPSVQRLLHGQSKQQSSNYLLRHVQITRR